MMMDGEIIEKCIKDPLALVLRGKFCVIDLSHRPIEKDGIGVKGKCLSRREIWHFEHSKSVVAIGAVTLPL